MRGKNNLHKSFDDVRATTCVQPDKRQELKARNKLLLARYYYYTVLMRRSYEYTIITLQSEIFLSKIHIIRLLEDNVSQLREMHKLKPSVSVFKNQWPHWRW